MDKSEAMLAVAREAIVGLPTTAGKVTLCHADMRDFILPLREKPRIIAIPFRSILHLLTPEDIEECLRHIHANLAPGGKLIFNIFVPDAEFMAQNHNRLRLRSDYIDPATQRHIILWDLSLYEPTEQRITVYAITDELDDEGIVVRRKYRTLPLRFMYPQETRYLLEKAGFGIAALYGWFDRRPFGPDSREVVWIAERT
ncbi:MAG: class I SAM-dependent methyltransferase [Chloroflexi bacterium]|nr:class I SAM-dependent methyltransferase [Chloroflexota bacterium]